MKKFAVAAMMIVIALAYAPPVFAGVSVNDLVKFGDGVGHPGGIYYFNDLTRPVPIFPTFCVELNEHLDFVNSFRVGAISTISVAGNKTLSPFTAWMYDRFLGHGGGLPLYVPNDFVAANTVQLAIWKGIGYTQPQIDALGSGFYGLYNFYLVNYYKWEQTFNTQVANNQWSGIGNVRIVNLKTLQGQNAQDVLIEIPEPLGVIVWPLIAACIGGGWKFYTRRKS